MQILYNLFYREYGVRRLQNLLSPRLSVLGALPRDSVVHFINFDESHPDIDTSKLYFGKTANRIFVDYYDTLKEIKGFPRKKPVLIRNLVRDFHRQNKKFKFLPEHYLKIKDAQSLLIYNYSYLKQIYHYNENPLVKYNEWWNIERTIISNINALSDVQNKNHFLFLNVPDELPSLNMLNLFSDKVNPSMLKLFDSSEKLFILELWKWIGIEHRLTSIFQDLTQQHFNKLNLVLTTKDGRSCVINFGYINSWIKGNENTTEFSSVSQIEANQMQKLFLKLFITLQSSSIDDEIEQIEETPVEVPSSDTDDEEDEDVVQTAANHDLYLTSLNKQKAPVSSVKEIDDKELTAALNDDVDVNSILKDIDTDLKSLEVISSKKLQNKGITVTKDAEVVIAEDDDGITAEDIESIVFNNNSYHDDLINQIEQAADVGLFSASDYKKALKDIDTFKSMPDPYGSGKTIEEAAVITEQDVAIEEENVKIVASPLVKDQGMLKSTLQSYDRDYIKKLAHKDVLSMVVNIQRAGVIVKNHEIEIDSSALGTYENHTLELKPLDGQISRIHFRIPKVEEDGSFVASGNKYFMRKQRVDAPIRKIAPNQVQLTSYYGKTFVTLSDKKADSSLEWLVKELNKIAMEEHHFFKKIAPADVFDNNFKSPYMYGALSHRFKSIQTRDFTLVFDHTERVKMVSEDLLSKLEKNDSKLIGYDNKRQPIVIDKDSNFFLYSNGVNQPLGDIFQLLQFDVSKVPVDFTEVRIFAKSIPVGVILAYFLGFKNLLKFLKVKYRVIEGRKNKNLEPYEFGITFSDQTFIFNRKDRVNSMILGGFLEYEREIKRYETSEFNHKDVYLNLLQTKGLSSLYIREMELNNQLFVDPVTRSILLEMKEPVTFNGLLVRSTEILQTYYHPDPQDMSVMRIRGYERIAGAVYKELTAAVRKYRNKNIAGKSKIDISPYQVWSTIMKDPSIKLVEDINPIQNLKEAEIVTYVGEGGRAKESMNKPSRAFHVNEMGITSEATVDSSDVGINSYLSADPNFKNLRGLPIISKNLSSANLVSTSALLSPGVEQDD